jgi:uroporphyrinogen decarboxylase
MASVKPRDILLEALELGMPERIPAAFFGAGVWTLHDAGYSFLDLAYEPRKMADTIISASEKLQSDIVYAGSGYNNFHAAALGGKIKIREVGAPDLEAPLVNSPEDLDKLDIDSLGEDKVISTIREATKLIAEEIGDGYLVTTTSWGPFTLGAQIRGVEALMRDIFKNPTFAHDVIDFSVDMIIKFFEPLLEEGVIDLITLADPTASGDLISKNQYEKFALPYVQKVSKFARNKGARVLLHVCGDTTDRLDLMGQTGVDCFSLDHKVDIGYAKEQLGGKMCIGGNVDPVHVLASGTEEDVETAARNCIEKAANGGGYILMPGCDHPPTTPLKNLQAFVNSAK